MHISNTTNPEDIVKDSHHFTTKGNKVSIELNETTKKWTHCVRIEKFTNYFHNQKEVGNMYFKLIDQLLPFIKERGLDVAKEKHCHLLKDDKRALAGKIIKKIHGYNLDPDTDIWELGSGQGIRLVAIITRDENNNDNVYPLFLDQFHLIFPSKNYNDSDYSKKACAFSPSHDD